MQKQKLTAYANQQGGIDFVSALPNDKIADIISMYICTMHPNYKILLSQCKIDEENCKLVFVKKNALPIKCVFAKGLLSEEVNNDTSCCQTYYFCGFWDEICPEDGKRSMVECINEKLFSTNCRAISRADLFNFIKQNYGNGLFPYVDEKLVF